MYEKSSNGEVTERRRSEGEGRAGPGERPLAVVTGASNGIGRELANQFADHGFDLIVAAEDARITAAARELERRGADTRAVQVDLGSVEGVDELCDAIDEDGRPVEAIALNAGVGLAGDFVRDETLEDVLQLLRLDVVSTVHLTKCVLEGMVAAGRGRVLYTSSIASMTPGPHQVVYSASKSFVQSFAEGLRQELADTGVTVTALVPGPTETEFFERSGLFDTKLGNAPKDDAAAVAEQGFQALMAGRDRVVAGSRKTKATTAAMEVVPDSLEAAMYRRQTEPGSAN